MCPPRRTTRRRPLLSTPDRGQVTVHLFDDETAEHPDSVFPNNWFSTHNDGRIALYPMYAQNRRGERRPTSSSSSNSPTASRKSPTTPDSSSTGSTWRAPARWCSTTRPGSHTRRGRDGPTKLLHRFCTAFGARADDVRRPRRGRHAGLPTNVMMCVYRFRPRLPGRDRRREAPQRGRRTAARDGKTVVALTQAQVRAFCRQRDRTARLVVAAAVGPLDDGCRRTLPRPG